MDLKTFLFNNNISIQALADALYVDRTYASRIVYRQVRPRGVTPYIIEHLTCGQVTVDELVNPTTHPVSWAGDKAREGLTRPVKPKKPRTSMLAAYKPLIKPLEDHGQINQQSESRCQSQQQEESEKGHQDATQSG